MSTLRGIRAVALPLCLCSLPLHLREREGAGGHRPPAGAKTAAWQKDEVWRLATCAHHASP
jgi:hypothetical protein